MFQVHHCLYEPIWVPAKINTVVYISLLRIGTRGCENHNAGRGGAEPRAHLYRNLNEIS